jgi:DNA polymerase III subunit beta
MTVVETTEPKRRASRARTAEALTVDAAEAPFAVILPQNRLLPILTAAARCAAEKTTLPVLKNALLEIRDGELIVTATNTATTLLQRVPVLGAADGAISTPARELAQFVAALPAGDVTLSLKGPTTELHIQSGRTEFRLPTLEPDYFPSVPKLDTDEIRLALPCASFSALIRETVYATNPESSTPAFSSVALRLRDGELTMWATDSHRIAVRKEPIQAEDSIELLLPTESVREVARLLTAVAGDVEVLLTPNTAEFRLPGLSFWTQLVAGNAANYEKPLKLAGDLRYALIRVPFVETLKRMRLAKPEGTVFRFGDSLRVSARGEGAFCEEETDLVVSGPEMVLAANVNLMIECLDAWISERVEIFLKDADSIILLRPEGSEQSCAAVMPMAMPEGEE